MPPGRGAFQGHVLATGDVLATWVVELVVHHLDLGLEVEVEAPAPVALGLALATVEAMAGEHLPTGWSDEESVLVGTGRTRPSDVQKGELGVLAQRLPVLG